jgi:hypothetical protein
MVQLHRAKRNVFLRLKNFGGTKSRWINPAAFMFQSEKEI